MRKIITSLSCILFTLSLFCITGCRKNSEEETQIAESAKKIADSIKPDTKTNEYNFVIGTVGDWPVPIVKYRMDGKTCLMVVDTGCHDNWLTKSGVKKVFSGMTFPLDYNVSYKYVNGQIEGLEYILDPENNVFYFFPDELDGLLGLSWLWKHNRMVEQNDNVVIDYVNNKIMFNQKPITEDSIPLVYDKVLEWYKIPFTFNGRELYGYIDTGSYALSIEQWLDEEKDENGVYVVKDFAIGNIHYENIKLNSWKEGISAESATHNFASRNVLGYPCFKDHIIQMDFKNNVFRIK